MTEKQSDIREKILDDTKILCDYCRKNGYVPFCAVCQDTRDAKANSVPRETSNLIDNLTLLTPDDLKL